MPLKDVESRRKYQREWYRNHREQKIASIVKFQGPRIAKYKAKHTAEWYQNVDLTELKNCPKCDEQKPLSHFSRQRGSPDGFSGYCRNCAEEMRRAKKYNTNHGGKKSRKAQSMAQYYVPLGNACEECGSKEHLERHHPDYDKPLEAQTLCRECHQHVHSFSAE